MTLADRDLVEKAGELRYRDIRGFKYQLAEDYVHETRIKPFAPILHQYISLRMEGQLTIKAGFFWDGPSGPALDTKSFVRASLIHDSLYRIMKSGDLDISFRDQADLLMYDICIEDGMSKFRAGYVYRMVRLFGRSSAR